MRMLGLLLLLAVPEVWAGPVTLLFDDVITSSAVEMPAGYWGLDWENMRVVRGEFAPDSGYERGVVSGPNVAANPEGNPASFSLASGTFDLASFYATAAWNEGLQATFTGYLGTTQVYQYTGLLSILAPTLIELNWSGINRVEFSGTGGVDNPSDRGSGLHIVLDNIVFGRLPGSDDPPGLDDPPGSDDPLGPDPPVSEIPEAGTVWLLGAGLLGLLYHRRWVAR